MIALLALAPAFAQQDASLCKGGFTDEDWRVRLQSSQDALGSLEVDVARTLLDRTRLQMVCLERVADPELVAELAHGLAWLAFSDQDEQGAVRWLLLARAAAPDVALPETFPAGLRALDQETEDPPMVGSEGRLVPPKGGGIFLDGHLLLEPKAAAEVPGILQVADGDGRILSTTWIDSGLIPEEWLGAEGPPPKAPRWYERETAVSAEPMTVKRSNAPALVPLAASGGLAILAGTLYAVGGATRGSLGEATDEDALAAARSRTNILAMSGLALGAGAVGVGVVAFVSADATVTFSFRF